MWSVIFKHKQKKKKKSAYTLTLRQKLYALILKLNKVQKSDMAFFQ